MTVQFYAGNADATILVSKKGGRYRIQSSCIEAAWLLVRELVDRLPTYYSLNDTNKEQFAFSK